MLFIFFQGESQDVQESLKFTNDVVGGKYVLVFQLP